MLARMLRWQDRHSRLSWQHRKDAMSDTPTAWPVLSVPERRVLGVLVEKAKTTPDVYPMSLNGIVTGSNQKSNRDPVLELSEEDVEEALVAAQKQGLTTRITGSRVEKWRHNLYDVWKVNKVELAVLAELLLRGPQTEGELRGRASRMEPIADLEALREVLKPLAERQLIVFLGPEGRRGTMLTHGFHSPQELASIPRREDTDREEATPVSQVGRSAEHRENESGLREEVAALRTEVAELRTQVQRLQEVVTSLSARATA
jgi:uncharacterized protein YceH (UPF0502 family)